MKREIIFRGKRIDNGEWVFGNLVQEPLALYISWVFKPSSNESSWVNFKDRVDPESVGVETMSLDEIGQYATIVK